MECRCDNVTKTHIEAETVAAQACRVKISRKGRAGRPRRKRFRGRPQLKSLQYRYGVASRDQPSEQQHADQQWMRYGAASIHRLRTIVHCSGKRQDVMQVG